MSAVLVSDGDLVDGCDPNVGARSWCRALRGGFGIGYFALHVFRRVFVFLDMSPTQLSDEYTAEWTTKSIHSVRTSSHPGQKPINEAPFHRWLRSLGEYFKVPS